MNPLDHKLAVAGWALGLLLAASSATAEEIKIELTGLHLCCGGCSAALAEALADVSGLLDKSIEQEAGSAAFFVADTAAADAALAAVAKAGFGAAVKRQGQTAAFPAEKIDPELRQDVLRFQGVHLCCKGCVRGVLKAFEGAAEVVSVDCDLKARTVTLSGKNISVAGAQKRLIAAGYYGTLVKP